MAKTPKAELKEAEKAIEKAEKLEEKEEKQLEAKTQKVKEEKEIELKKETTAEKKAKLLEKAKALEKAIDETEKVSVEKIKIKKEDDEVKKDTLVPMEDYLKSSIHLGTRVITPDMRSYVYRRRADGLAVFNTALLDDKIREGADYLAQFAPGDMILVCKREAGWKAADKFAELFGIRKFTKKYPAGILTNTNLDNFFETKLVFICDPWLDKNALADANKVNVPVLSICDTNNFTRGVKKIIPRNNKSGKSVGMILYLLARIYSEKRNLNVQIPPIQEFIDDWDNLQPPK